MTASAVPGKEPNSSRGTARSTRATNPRRRRCGTSKSVAEFRWALAQLPARQRAVLVLRYWADLSVAEVADILGCSAATVTSTASRAAARLAQALAHGEPAATDPHGSGKPERTL